MRLVYHRGHSYSEFDLTNYVYLRNLLSEASEKIASEFGDIVIMSDNTQPFWDATHRVKYLGAKKGLPRPRDAFGKGGDALGTNLLLYGDGKGELEFFWSGCEAVQAELERIITEGTDHLGDLLLARTTTRRSGSASRQSSG